VVVKGHPAHPGTGELVAGAVAEAAADLGMPAGVFSLLNGPSHELGRMLVADARIKAVGFTGSRQAGTALLQVAAERREPIPVYAEMSSVNPVILLPGAVRERAEQLAQAFVSSLCLGAGQFCTNPGLVFAIDVPALERFIDTAAAAVQESPAAVMLTPRVHEAFEQGVERLAARAEVAVLARGREGDGCNLGQAALFGISAEDFTANEDVSREIFGASAVLVRCRDADALAKVLAGLEAQLTMTLHLARDDEELARALVPVLEEKAGRLIANGWPTGVEVAHAIVHGGPFPATSDGRTSSVGTLAIERFLRPVCYQDFPHALLPTSLRSNASHGVLRRIDGAWQVD
jgi:NADP-dependent aldehyde dehydrogenase